MSKNYNNVEKTARYLYESRLFGQLGRLMIPWDELDESSKIEILDVVGVALDVLSKNQWRQDYTKEDILAELTPELGAPTQKVHPMFHTKPGMRNLRSDFPPLEEQDEQGDTNDD